MSSSSSLALEKEIIRRIESTGPITFAEFMEVALYQPELGYYTSGRTIWGKDGDYITSLDAGPIFA
ncbi:MAG: class I SAM-dependent methyltransferase, partial [Thermodesulfobacteriota bacterium]